VGNFQHFNAKIPYLKITRAPKFFGVPAITSKTPLLYLLERNDACLGGHTGRTERD